jgi:plasmid replication initiation protein
MSSPAKSAVKAAASRGDLLSRFPNIARSAAEAEARLAARGEEAEGSQLFLPFWTEQFRALPSEIFRSALFNARNKTKVREYMKDREIVVIGPGAVVYTGEELRQDDETVWLQLIQLAKTQPLGGLIQFTANSFLKAIDWPVKSESYVRLRACLTRMQATSLRVSSKRLGEESGKALSMIPEFDWQDQETSRPLRRYAVRLAPSLVNLFGGKGHFTRVEWAQRLSLPDGLARWLHGYYASHSEPYPVKLETIRVAAGLTTERIAHLRTLVENALNELTRVQFLKAWEIKGPNGDLVIVERATAPEAGLSLLSKAGNDADGV